MPLYAPETTVPVFLLEKGKVTRQDLPPDDSRVEPYSTGFLSSLNTHLAEKNWKSVYFQHILDEPHGSEPPYYARIADLVHRNMPGVLTIDAVDASDIPEELKKNCDVWVPQLGRFDNQMELNRDRIQSGHDVWFYTCLFPNKRYLNRLIQLVPHNLAKCNTQPAPCSPDTGSPQDAASSITPYSKFAFFIGSISATASPVSCTGAGITGLPNP